MPQNGRFLLHIAVLLIHTDKRTDSRLFFDNKSCHLDDQGLFLRSPDIFTFMGYPPKIALSASKWPISAAHSCTTNTYR